MFEGNAASENGEHSNAFDGLTDTASAVIESEDFLLGSPSSASASLQESVNSIEGDPGSGSGSGRDSNYQRYELQQVGRWIEQILPFSLLLLVVFIRQHLQGNFHSLAVIFSSPISLFWFLFENPCQFAYAFSALRFP